MRICLLSSERPGSNLLRLILNAHSEISGPPAPQISRVLAPNLYLYGDLKQDENFEQLVRDMIALTRIHPEPWPETVTVDDVCTRTEERTFWAAFDALYTLNAEHVGKSHWLSKENNLFDYAFEILHALSGVKFIYLVRDGRDYACSMRKMPGGHFHYFQLARQWGEEQAKCLRIYRQLKDTGLMWLVRYEDLLRSPQSTIENLTGFLNVPFQCSMLEYHKSRAAQTMAGKSEYWKNLSKPLVPDNFNKFKRLMNPSDIRLFESVAGTELNMLGYECVSHTPRGEISTWQRWVFTCLDTYLRWRHRSTVLREPGRASRKALMKSIKNRLVSSGRHRIWPDVLSIN